MTDLDNTQPAPAARRANAAARIQGAALWARDSGLGSFGFALVLAVAVAGWAASFIGLHLFGMQHMSLSRGAAWLVPATFDGAPAGLSIVVMRAGIHGRTAGLWRFLIVAFTGLSSWINWEHINDPTGRWVAAFMPPSAVILFEGLMSEVRAAARRRSGVVEVASLPIARWLFAPVASFKIVRWYVLQMPLPAAMRGAPAATATTPAERHESVYAGATATATEAPGDATHPATGDATKRASAAPQSDPRSATESATTAATETLPQRHQSAQTAATVPATKRTKKPQRKHTVQSPREAAREAIRAMYDEYESRPLESQMVARLKEIKCPFDSPAFAKKIRAEIEKHEPHLAALGQDNVRPLTGS